MLKKCTKCFEVKPETEFYLRRRNDPNSDRQTRCNKCHTEVVRSYDQRKRAERIEAGWRALDVRRVGC